MAEVMSVGPALEWARAVVRQWGVWTRSHLLMTVVLSALAFGVGWVVNTYLMAFVLDGSNVSEDQDTAATADDRTANALFWLLLFGLLAGVATYAWSRGWKNFRADLATLPRVFAEAMTRNKTAAMAMLLWGAAVSLVISTLISSAVSLALGLVLLALAATPIGIILNFALIRLWRGLCGVVAPAAGLPLAAALSPFMVMLGESLGLFLDWVIGVWTVSLLLGIACAIASLVLARGTLPRPATGVFLAVAVVAWQVVRVSHAYADDGGWTECSTSSFEPCEGLGGIFAWAGSDGAGHVMARAVIGGAFSAAGAAIGAGLGGAAAGLAGAAAALTASSASTGWQSPSESRSSAEPFSTTDLEGGAGSQSQTTDSEGEAGSQAATMNSEREQGSTAGTTGSEGQAGSRAPARSPTPTKDSEAQARSDTQAELRSSAGSSSSPSSAGFKGEDMSSGRSAHEGTSDDAAQSSTAESSVSLDAASDTSGATGSQLVGPPSDMSQQPIGATASGAGAPDAGAGAPDAGAGASDAGAAAQSDSSDRGGHRPRFDIGDILPEDPDRERDQDGADGADITGDEDTGPTSEPPPAQP